MQNYNSAHNNSQQIQDQYELNNAMNLLAETHKNLKSAKGKNIVLFVGSTGAGKSTTINLLLGNELKEIDYLYHDNSIDPANPASSYFSYDSEVISEEDFEDEVIASSFKCLEVKDSSRPGPGIGHYGAETIYPSVYDSNQGLAFCDTAGLLDNRGDAHRLNCRFGIGLSIRVAQEFKGLVVVLSYEDLKAARGLVFNELAKFLLETFKSSDCYSTNFQFIVTKFPEEISDYYKSFGKVYDNKIHTVVELLTHIKSSQEKNTEGTRIKSIIDIILDNIKNITVLKRADLIDVKKALKYKQKINDFFTKAAHPIPKEAVNLGNGDILNEAYLKMFTRIRVLGTETINGLSKDKLRLIQTKDWVNNLWQKLTSAKQQVQTNQTCIKNLEAEIKKTETECYLKIADLQKQKLALPGELKQQKDQELIKATQDIQNHHQQIEDQINQSKNNLLDLHDNKSDSTQTDAKDKIRNAKQEIAKNLQTIQDLKDDIQDLKQKVSNERSDADNKITIYGQAKDIDIQNKQNEINIWNQNQKPEYQQLQQKLNRLDGNISQKNQAINQLNNQITAKNNQINLLATDTSEQQVGETISYDEHAVYGITLNRGFIKGYKLSVHSSDVPLVNMEYWGNTGSQSEGTAGYFDVNSRSLTSQMGQITYYGPSHCDGYAYFRVFAQKKDLPATKSAIAALQNDITQLKTQINDLQGEIRDLNRDKTNEQTQHDTQKKQAVADLNNDITALKNDKGNNRNRLDKAFDCFKLIKDGEIDLKENEISTLKANNTRLENDKTQYKQLKFTDKTKLIQEKAKISNGADVEILKNNQDKDAALKKCQTSIEDTYKDKEKAGIKALEKEISQIENHAQTQLTYYKNQIDFKKEDIACEEKYIKETLIDIENGNKIIADCIMSLENSKGIFDEHQNNFSKVVELVKLLEGYRFEGFDEFIKKFNAFIPHQKNFVPIIPTNTIADSTYTTSTTSTTSTPTTTGSFFSPQQTSQKSLSFVIEKNYGDVTFSTKKGQDKEFVEAIFADHKLTEKYAQKWLDDFGIQGEQDRPRKPEMSDKINEHKYTLILSATEFNAIMDDNEAFAKLVCNGDQNAGDFSSTPEKIFLGNYSKNCSHDEITTLLIESKQLLQESKDGLIKSMPTGTQPLFINGWMNMFTQGTSIPQVVPSQAQTIPIFGMST